MLNPFHLRVEVILQLTISLWRNQFSLNWILTLPRTISWDDRHVEFAQSGDASALQKTFSEGLATPFDLLPDGSTLLHVSFS